MSSWGATEIGGDAISAWEFREAYVLYGEQYSEFFCPFCDIPLVGMLIYAEELSRSPHFAARDGRHLWGCDGEPLVVDPPDKKPPRAHYKPRRMGVPEALSDRPPARVYGPKRPPRTPIPPITETDVKTRRLKGGSLGKPIPKTYLLRSIVEAHDVEWKESYDLARKKKWDDDKRKAETKKVLSAMPLRLDDLTTYDDAFRWPTFIHPQFRRIYHGTGVVALDVDGGLIISSKRDGKLKGTPMPFKIQIDSRTVTPDSPKSHIALLEQLEILASNAKEIRWYAYGRPAVQPGAIVVPVQNFDHLYFKKAYTETPRASTGPT